VPNGGIRTVVDAFDVDPEKTIEISFAGSLDRSYVRDACIVHKNVQALLAREFVEDGASARLIGNIARIGLRIASVCGNLLRRDVSSFFVKIENPYRGALLDETLRDGTADPTTGTGNDGDFAVKAKSITMWRGGAQSETPRFQGMKSFCASSSALV
jgi:hypothetical protein